MSALAKMVVDMMLKELPEEVRAQMTAENFQKVSERITAFMDSVPAMARALEDQQKLLEDILEKVSKDDDKRNGSRGSRGRTIAIASNGDDTAPATGGDG